MGWQIDISAGALRQIKKLGHEPARRVRAFLRRLESLDNPRQQGKALSGEFSAFWRYRVGDYRLICEIKDQQLQVLVLRVAHRKQIYR